MKSRAELIKNVKDIGKDAQSLLDIARNKAANDANLTKAEIKRINSLIKRSEEAFGEANQRAKARRAEEIKELQAQINNIEASLSVSLPRDTVEFLKRKKRNLRTRLHHRQARAALDFGGIISSSELGKIQASFAEAKQAVAKRKKAAGFIKSLFQFVELATGIVSKATGMF